MCGKNFLLKSLYLPEKQFSLCNNYEKVPQKKFSELPTGTLEYLMILQEFVLTEATALLTAAPTEPSLPAPGYAPAAT